MAKTAKRYYWLGGGAALLLALLLAFYVIAPRVVDSEWLKGRIQAELAGQLEGEVNFQTADLRFFPTPGIDITNLQIEIPDYVSARIKSLEVYPALLPLLSGKVHLKAVDFNEPEISIQLPDRSVRKKTEQEPRYTDWLDFISKQLLSLIEVIPGLEIELHGGSINLVDKGQVLFFFGNIIGEVEVEKENLTVDLRYSSNVADSVKFSASISPTPLKGKGRISLEKIRARAASQYFLPDLPALIDENFASLQLVFSLDPDQGFQAKFVTTEPEITVRHKEENIVLQGRIFKGNLQLGKEKSLITVDDLTLTNPQLEISGSVLLNPSKPYYDINLEAKGIGIPSSREVVPKIITAVYGELPVVNEVFDYVRAGRIFNASFRVKGKSLDEISSFQNMVFQGQLDQGQIHIPDYDLNLENVSGDAAIANSVLDGTNLAAQMGNTRVKNSSVKIGLMGEDEDPFHLDLQLDADLAEVPPVLERVVTNRAFLEYMSRLTKVSGQAQGRLVLGENFKDFSTRVDVEQMNFEADYSMVPYPVRVTSGKLHYEGDVIKIVDNAGRVGKTSFSELTGTQNWKDETRMEITSGNFKVDLSQVYEWISSIEQLQDQMEDIKDLRGLAEVEIQHLTGPILNARNWDYEALCTFENARTEITFFPEPITLESGQAKLSQDKMVFEALQANVFDSTLTVTGEITGFRDDNLKADLGMDGTINHDASHWLSELIDLPPGTYFQTPFTLNNARFVWQDDKAIGFSSDLSFKAGPRAALDFARQDEVLRINKLSVQDEASQADFSMTAKERTVEFAFSGKLDRSTLEKMLVRDQYRIGGWLQGDFEAHVFLDDPMKSMVKGTIEGENLVLPLLLEDPVHIRRISLAAEDNLLQLKKLDFNLHENQFTSQGSIKISEGEFAVDLDLNTEKLVWEDMQGFLPEDKEEKESSETGQAEPWNLPVHGKIRFNADTFSFGEYVMQPVVATFILNRNAVDVNVSRADLCNISLPGTLKITPGGFGLALQPLAQNQNLQKTIDCFHPEKFRMTGSYGLAGELTAPASAKPIAESMHGEIKLKAKEGIIYREKMLSSVFTFLNLTNIFRFKLPSLTGKEELKYQEFTAAVVLKNGRMEIKESFLDTEAVDVIFEGSIDYFKKRINMVVLVVASKAVSTITDKIPIVRRLTGSGSLFSVPVRVSGSLDSPSVVVLSPTGLGENILRILKKTFTGGVDFVDIEAGQPTDDN